MNITSVTRDTAMNVASIMFVYDTPLWHYLSGYLEGRGCDPRERLLAWRDVHDADNEWLPVESFREKQDDKAELVAFLRALADALEPSIEHFGEKP